MQAMCKATTGGPIGTAPRTEPLPREILSQIPSHPACEEALALAQSSLQASIFHHSLRVFFYATAFSKIPPPSPEVQLQQWPASPMPAPHVLFVACILHDVGTAHTYDSHPERFEVAGADTAAGILRKHGVDEIDAREAWLAIALHTSQHVAENAGRMIRTVRLAVRADFGSMEVPDLGPNAPDLLTDLPRMDLEKDLGDAVVRQVLERCEKAPGASWPRDLLRAKEADPEWDGVNKAF